MIFHKSLQNEILIAQILITNSIISVHYLYVKRESSDHHMDRHVRITYFQATDIGRQGLYQARYVNPHIYDLALPIF